MKIQKQITVTEYKGYQLRHSSETGHVGVCSAVISDGVIIAWVRIRACNSMALAEAYVDKMMPNGRRVDRVLKEEASL